MGDIYHCATVRSSNEQTHPGMKQMAEFKIA